MKCPDCGASVVSAGLAYCPRCTYPLHGQDKRDTLSSMGPSYIAGIKQMYSF